MMPPVLPDEAWRGDIDGPVCVTMRDGRPTVWWWCPQSDDGWLPTGGEDIWKAWALHLSAEVATLRSRAVADAEGWRLLDAERAESRRLAAELADFRAVARGRL